MPFIWKAFLLAIVMSETSHAIVKASDLPESHPEKDADMTILNKQPNEKEREETGEPTVTRKCSGSDWLSCTSDNTYEVGAKKDEGKKQLTDVIRRQTRSVKAHSTDVSKKDDGDLMKMRSATARLTKHLRSLSVSQEKTAPLVFTDDGEAKVHLYGEITVMSILDVSDIQQTVKTRVFMFLTWRDEALTWNTSLYEGVDTVLLSPDSTWTPPIFVANALDLKDVMEEAKHMEVTHDGNVSVKIPFVVETSCAMDLTWYPFDEQTCSIMFVMKAQIYQWTVAEQADEDTANELALNSEWQLTNISIVMVTPGGHDLTPKAVMTLRRKTTFYRSCLIQPMVVTLYMNSLVFLIPLESGEKISFMVALFVSTSFFTGFFSSTMPRGLDTAPISMKLLVGVVVESVLVLLATLFILKRFHAEKEASAAYACSQEEGPRHASDEHDPVKGQESFFFALAHTGKTPPQPVPNLSQSGAAGTTRLPSRTHSVTTWERAGRVSRAKRACGLKACLSSRQLDWIMFVVSVTGNTIYLLVIMYDVM